MLIRVANQMDLPALIEIYNQAIEAGHQTAHLDPVTVASRQTWFDEHMERDQLLLVSVDEDQVLGYLTLSAYRRGRRALQKTKEVSMYIHRDYQRRGIASALLEYALELCIKMDITSLMTIMLATNQPSIAFFKNKGFEVWGQLPGVAEIENKPVDQIYMGRQV